ncbi:MAG: type III pantothenate kinase [Desulfobacterales bacterium]|jgi:type III pantothenate kinase|nr:type III pantothenate kinase [Desulfobacterales bacterium]MCU0585494.1 type III pantothenate kinase [Desulfobacterales bacterium]
MLLAINVNNTNTSFGLHREGGWIAHWRIATDRSKQPDELAMLLRSLCDYARLSWSEVSGVALSSVVPPLTPVFAEMSRRYLGHEPLVVSNTIRTGVRILIDYPAEIGADRILNALGAKTAYGGPCIVVDFGTATTFDALSAEGDYVGGAIAPGLGIAAEALFARTAKLPRIELTAPPAAIGKNTVHAMQSGLVLGYVGLIETLVGRIGAELGGQVKVVATGGMAHILAEMTPAIQTVDPMITLEGLRLIYHLNR